MFYYAQKHKDVDRTGTHGHFRPMVHLNKSSEGVLHFNERPFFVSKEGEVSVLSLFTKKNTTPKRRVLKSYVNRSNGYCYVRLNADGATKLCSVHRLVGMAYVAGFCEEKDIHHIDGNRTNNHLENLKSVTRSENLRSKMEPRGVSKYRGVTFRPRYIKKWLARVRDRNGNEVDLGRHETEEEAALAFNAGAIVHGYDKTALNDL